MSSWAQLRERGAKLRDELRATIDQATPPPRHRRQSVLEHSDRRCDRFFHHPSAFRTRGVDVARNVHSSFVVRSCAKMCVDAINTLKRDALRSETGDVQYVDMAVMRGPRDAVYGAVRVYGPRPHTGAAPPHNAIVTAEPGQAYGLPLRELAAGAVATLPIYVGILVADIKQWEVCDGVTEMNQATRLPPEEYPRLYAALRKGRRVDDGSKRIIDATGVEVPLFGAYAWVDVDNHKWGMVLDTAYQHAICVVLTPQKDAVVVDSNTARPSYVDAVLEGWLTKSMGFRYALARLPQMNQEDALEVRRVLATLGVDTSFSLAGYCTSLTLAYLIDVVCTGRYEADHFLRFVEDVVPQGASALTTQVCFVLYARAVANDCVRLCQQQIKAGNMTVCHHWPRVAPVETEHATTRITHDDVAAAVRRA